MGKSIRAVELAALSVAGRKEFFSRTESSKTLAKCISNVHQRQVVRCVAEGLSNREIASRLKLTEHTVKNYLFRIFDKLGVSSRVEVVLYVFRLRKDLAANLPENKCVECFKVYESARPKNQVRRPWQRKGPLNLSKSCLAGVRG